MLPTVCLGQHITQDRSIFGGKEKTKMPGSFRPPGAVSPSEPVGEKALALLSRAITVLTEPMNLGVKISSNPKVATRIYRGKGVGTKEDEEGPMLTSFLQYNPILERFPEGPGGLAFTCRAAIRDTILELGLESAIFGA